MPSQNLKPSQTVHGFVVERIEDIPELRCEAAVFTHEKTGCRLVHVFNDDPNNLFCIGFRTPVYDNTGVPHILEHSVLSGSAKFPLKDPFKEMLKGSLQTFLNALTYPDKTIYPVSSQVEADFYNLADVYCDAVFHPLLTETTFCQEGWHFDVEQPGGPIDIKGIVYNEMKGVFSDFRSHVARRSIAALLPDTTYFFNSGGDPEAIPDLTYAQFREFHSRYYHPSNAFVFVYGNIPSEKTLRFLHEKYLSGFQHGAIDSQVKPQPRWSAPRRIAFEAPASAEDNGAASVIVCWLLQSATDPVAALCGSILSRYLLGSEGAPLRRALIDSGLGEDLDDMCGFDADIAQTVFCAGLRKTRAEHADKIKQIVIDTLAKQADEGLDEKLLEGTIRQTEFRLREISDGGHFPHSLMLAERCYRSWLYGGDPLAHVRFEGSLQEIQRGRAADSRYFRNKIRELFCDNPHQLLSVVVGSAVMGEKLGKLTSQQAQRLTAPSNDAQRRSWYDLTKRLREEQAAAPTPEALATLPKLDKKDLPRENQAVPTELGQVAGVQAHMHPLFTAGILYWDISFDLSVLPPDLLVYFPLYSEMIGRCGAAGHSYEDMAKRVALSTGGISCSDLCAQAQGGALALRAFYHGKALEGRLDEMGAIFADLFGAPQLDDTKLLGDIVLEMRNDLSASVVQSGHTFAVSRAEAALSESCRVAELLDGLSQLRFLDRLAKDNAVENAANELRRLHGALVNRRTCHVCVTAENPQKYSPTLERLLGGLPESKPHFEAAAPAVYSSALSTAVEINSSVNFVARSWGIGPASPADSGLLSLLAKNLSTGFLWEKIRMEGGAYGGMAVHSISHPVFSCASYRDPNLSKTLENFEKGLAQVAAVLPSAEVDQSIIGTIGRIDKPRAPHSKAIAETTSLLCGRTPQYRQEIREAILSATPEALGRTAQRILDEKRTAVVVLGSASAIDAAQKEGLRFSREPLLPNAKN